MTEDWGMPILFLLGGWAEPSPPAHAITRRGATLNQRHQELIVPNDFVVFGFNEIWLMDDGPKYTSRRDPRAPADFSCFAPADKSGFWERERKRRPY